MFHPSKQAYEGHRAALYHPERYPVFTRQETAPPFETRGRSHSLGNAWWLSNASHLAYFARQDIERELRRVGLNLHAFFSQQGVQAYLSTGRGFAVLSFRGTVLSEHGNLRNDIDIRPAWVTEAVFVHEGFLRSLEAIWPEVDAALRDLGHLDVWYTGHSLGAAMATLAAMRRPPAGVYAFGSPRVGNSALAAVLDGIPIFRFVDCCDAITLLPPKPLGYHHVGEERFITSSQALIGSPSAGVRYRERARGYLRYFCGLPWLKPGVLPLRSLADHIIINYTHGIQANLPRV